MLSLDWQDSSTHVLFNPRMPEGETREIAARLKKLNDLSSHLWIATSGSTAQVAGKLKWIALSKPAVLASAQAVNTHLSSNLKDIWIHALPDFHVGGIGIFARAHLSGASVIDGLAADPQDLRHWDARFFHRCCEENQATLSALVPTQIYDLLKLGLRAPKSLRAIVIGGGALSESLYLEARKQGWNLLPSYGLTECCSQVATAELGSLKDPLQRMPLPRLLPHLEVAVSEDRKLRMRGPAVLSGIAWLSDSGDRWSDPKQEGWFQSEDIGEIENGFLKLQGRSSDFVKIGGESVDLNRLEKTFAALKAEKKPDFDLTLIAVPDERLGHVIHAAAAVSEESPRATQARSFFDRFNEQVLPFERVRRLHFVESIPRSPLQKLLQAELLKQIQSTP